MRPCCLRAISDVSPTGFAFSHGGDDHMGEVGTLQSAASPAAIASPAAATTAASPFQEGRRWLNWWSLQRQLQEREQRQW